MDTRIDEIEADVYRLSVFVPDIAPPAGFTFSRPSAACVRTPVRPPQKRAAAARLSRALKIPLSTPSPIGPATWRQLFAIAASSASCAPDWLMRGPVIARNIFGSSPANVAWFEEAMEGFKGRIARDKWIEQCQRLATGWRPEGSVGERPKG